MDLHRTELRNVLTHPYRTPNQFRFGLGHIGSGTEAEAEAKVTFKTGAEGRTHKKHRKSKPKDEAGQMLIKNAQKVTGRGVPQQGINFNITKYTRSKRLRNIATLGHGPLEQLILSLIRS